VVLLAALLLAASLASGCGSGEETATGAGGVPDVVGMTVSDAVDELRDAGVDEIRLFTVDVHAEDPWDADVDDDETVTMSAPESGEPMTDEVHLWLGERPDIPANVLPEAWYYPHRERIEARGTDPCLACHDRESCSVCHEQRLQETAELLRSDPAVAPDLADAAATAMGFASPDVKGLNQGDGWFRIEVPADRGLEPRRAAEAAREAAVVVFPAAFSAEPDAATVVLAWMDGERPVIEIGFERDTFEAVDWSGVVASDIPWIADRYAVPSD
jgi:hypothetical protein